MPHSLKHSHALVVFGGQCYDLALATDFCAISKKFIKDGLHPTCLSGIDLFTTVNAFKTLKFGRDDLGRMRDIVYTREEGACSDQFYRKVESGAFKVAIFDWLNCVKMQAVKGDRIIVVLCAHGQQDSGNVVLETQNSKEYLSKSEFGVALTGLAAGTRVLLVNEACYSGTWSTLAPDTPGKDILVEAASPIGGVSYNFRSSSQMTRCSLFAAAFVQELTVSPEGNIREHTSRIAAEMQDVADTQPTYPPTFACGPGSLWSFNISHFVTTPSIAAAIHSMASRQEQHEQSPSDSDLSTESWPRLPPQSHPPSPPMANADFGAYCIQNHLDMLDADGSGFSMAEAGLVSACVMSLKPDASPELRSQVIETIIWKEWSMMVAEGIIDALHVCGLIVRPIDMSTSLKLDIDNTVLSDLWEEVNKTGALDPIQDAPYPPCLPILWQNSAGWVIRVIGYSYVTSPKTFDMKKILDCVTTFLKDQSGMHTSTDEINDL